RAVDPLRGVDQATFDAEREVVRNELRERDELGVVTGASTRLMAALYPAGHPYARPGIGTEASIAALTLDGAKAFVAANSRPGEMTAVIAGDVALEQMPKILGGAVPKAMQTPAAPEALPKVPRLDVAPVPPPALPAGPRLTRVKSRVDEPLLVIGWSLPR